MMISSLDKAEKIVESNSSLKWDGWDIIHYTASNVGWMKPNGAFRNGKWFTTKSYALTSRGWDLPAKMVMEDAR